VPKIFSECYILVKLCHINCCSPVFLDTVCMSVFCVFFLLLVFISLVFVSVVLLCLFTMRDHLALMVACHFIAELYSYCIVLCSWQINKMWCDNGDVAPNQ